MATKEALHRTRLKVCPVDRCRALNHRLRLHCGDCGESLHRAKTVTNTMFSDGSRKLVPND